MTQSGISHEAHVCEGLFHMLENQRIVVNTLESSWNVDSDRVIGRNFPLRIHEIRDAYFRLLARTKDTRFCKEMM